MPEQIIRHTERHFGDVDVTAGYSLRLGGVAVASTAAQLDAAVAANIANASVRTAEVSFTEQFGAGTYTGAVVLPAGSTLLDVIVNGVVLWDATTSATLKVGDATDDDGYFTGVNLKATDLLAGESLSLAFAGGKAGAYVANSQVSPRYAVAARTITGVVTAVAPGSAGRTRMTVVYSVPTTVTAATAV